MIAEITLVMTLPYADVAALISFYQTAVFALIEANRHG